MKPNQLQLATKGMSGYAPLKKEKSVDKQCACEEGLEKDK